LARVQLFVVDTCALSRTRGSLILIFFSYTTCAARRGYIDHCRRVKKLLISAAPKTAAEAAGPTEGAALEATELGQMAAASTGTTNGVNPMAAVQATDMFGAFERQHLFENLKLKVRNGGSGMFSWVIRTKGMNETTIFEATYIP